MLLSISSRMTAEKTYEDKIQTLEQEILTLKKDNNNLKTLIQTQEEQKKQVQEQIDKLEEELEKTKSTSQNLQPKLTTATRGSDFIKPDLSNATKLQAKVTSYTPGYNAYEGGLNTALGDKCDKSLCAVDPKKIPYNSIIYIPGYGVVKARDTGAALRRYNGYQIDVVHWDYNDTIKWGVKYMDIYILRWGGDD